MTFYLVDGDFLLDGGSFAISEDCCCGGVDPDLYYCTKTLVYEECDSCTTLKSTVYGCSKGSNLPTLSACNPGSCSLYNYEATYTTLLSETGYATAALCNASDCTEFYCVRTDIWVGSTCEDGFYIGWETNCYDVNNLPEEGCFEDEMDEGIWYDVAIVAGPYTTSTACYTVCNDL